MIGVIETSGWAARFRQRFPRLWAGRHFAVGLARALALVVGIGLLFVVPLPSIELPSIPTPDLPDLPAMPDWVGTVLKWGKFVVLIVAGVLLTLAELERREQRSRERDRGEGDEG